MARAMCFRPRTVLLGVSDNIGIHLGGYIPSKKLPKRGVNRQLQAKRAEYKHTEPSNTSRGWFAMTSYKIQDGAVAILKIENTQ